MATNSNVWILCVILLGALILCFILGYITTSATAATTSFNPPQTSSWSIMSFGYMFFLGLVLFMLGMLTAYLWGTSNNSTNTTTSNNTNTRLQNNDNNDMQKYLSSIPNWFGDKYIDKPDNAKSTLNDYKAREDNYAKYTLTYKD